MERTKRLETPGDENLELRQLINRYRAGDSTAFDELHQRLCGCLRALFRRKGLATDQVENLVQETFLQAFLSIESYDPSRDVKPWIYGIARNVYRMDRRAAMRRRIETSTLEDCHEPAVSPAAGDLPDRSWVVDAVDRLPAERRVPLILHHVWGYSHREIAGALGIRESAAKVRAHRAKGELRGLLTEQAPKAA
jgi:RNA polymerase sigma-70 factor (ECF subfamily)